MSNIEPYGTTPLPAKSVSIRYDPGDVWDVAQQPKSQQIAAYEGIKNDESIHGATVFDVNHHFCIYAVKKGLIRILHRHSTLRTLFRGHEGQVVTDIQIFLDGDVLGSVGSANGSSTVIIWRVFERTPEIMSEKLLEITTSAYTISRLIWHPFNPNQFWIIHTKDDAAEGEKQKVASLVDTTRISTLPHSTEQHAVCMYHTPNIIMEGAVELSAPSASSLTDLDWSEKDVRHVLTAYHGGEIRLWDLRKLEHAHNQATMLPSCVCMIQEEQPLSRCKFLPHECPRDQPSKRENAYTNCFLTAANNNTVVTLWSPFGESGPPTKLQVFGLDNPSPSYLLDICYGPSPPDGPPPSLFVLMADQSEGKLFSWHLRSEWQEQTVVALVGCDYVVPFLASFPMYSWSTQVQPAADISEDELTDQGGLVFDMKLFSYQSTVVQCLTLTSFMCLPPASQWEPSTPGVTVEELTQEQEATDSPPGGLAMSEDFDGEDYDVGDDDIGEEADDYDGAPEASSLPVPEGLESPATGPVQSSGGGAFANWLGALAVKGSSGSEAIPPPPMPQGMPPASTMLTPSDLFPHHPSFQTADTAEEATPTPPPPGMNVSENGSYDRDQSNLSSTQNKKKNNRKGKSRSRSPTNNRSNKQNGGKGQQQQPQAAQDVTILQRKPDETQSAPPAVEAPAGAPAQANPGVALTSKQLADLFQKQEAAITRGIHSAVEKEMKNNIVPLIDEKVRACVNDAVGPVMSSINKIGQSGVQVDHDMLVNAITAKVEAPLRATFAENMKNVFIPAFQSVSVQMFSQVSASLENGMAQGSSAGGPQKKEMEDLTRQIATMAAQMQHLTTELSGLKAMVSEKGMAGGQLKTPGVAPALSAAEQKQALEQEVLVLLQQRQYEAAFTKALSASTVEMALFVCRNADLADVLGGTSPSLSQPILLCLMHQLGTSVVTETNDEASLQTELAWLQEVSLSINPMDESMKRHLPGVLQQLVSGINDKMMRTDQQSRRPLQRLLQVLRGVQVQ